MFRNPFQLIKADALEISQEGDLISPRWFIFGGETLDTSHPKTLNRLVKLILSSLDWMFLVIQAEC